MNREKGVTLFLVLAIFLVAIIFAGAVLAIITSESRLTHHQISRIQAYYASLAAKNLAFEGLIKGTWSMPSVPGGGNSCWYTKSLQDDTFPRTINNKTVDITVASSGCPMPDGTVCSPPLGVPVCIKAKTDYTYTP